MNTDKYSRTITLRCPTCGSGYFENCEQSDRVACASCGNVLAQEDLVRANSETIHQQTEDVVKQAIEEVKRELKKVLQNAFKDNKLIKIR